MVDGKEAERRLLTALDASLELGARRGIPIDAAMAMAAAHAAGRLASLLGAAAASQFMRQLAEETALLPSADAEHAAREPAVRPGR